MIIRKWLNTNVSLHLTGANALSNTVCCFYLLSFQFVLNQEVGKNNKFRPISDSANTKGKVGIIK